MLLYQRHRYPNNIVYSVDPSIPCLALLFIKKGYYPVQDLTAVSVKAMGTPAPWAPNLIMSGRAVGGTISIVYGTELPPKAKNEFIGPLAEGSSCILQLNQAVFSGAVHSSQDNGARPQRYVNLIHALLMQGNRNYSLPMPRIIFLVNDEVY